MPCKCYGNDTLSIGGAFSSVAGGGLRSSCQVSLSYEGGNVKLHVTTGYFAFVSGGRIFHRQPGYRQRGYKRPACRHGVRGGHGCRRAGACPRKARTKRLMSRLPTVPCILIGLWKKYLAKLSKASRTCRAGRFWYANATGGALAAPKPARMRIPPSKPQPCLHIHERRAARREGMPCRRLRLFWRRFLALYGGGRCWPLCLAPMCF